MAGLKWKVLVCTEDAITNENKANAATVGGMNKLISVLNHASIEKLQLPDKALKQALEYINRREQAAIERMEADEKEMAEIVSALTGQQYVKTVMVTAKSEEKHE